MPSEQNPPKVFISYSHDSQEHRLRVYELLKKLREDGILCVTDHTVMSPPEGWQAWMEDRIKEADFTLVVCTETYRRRAERKEQPGVGLGVTWEATLITNEIYQNASRNTKFIPVLLSQEDVTHRPVWLEQVSYYRVDLEDGYELLLRHLTNQPLFEEPPVAAKVRELPPITRKKAFDEPEIKTSSQKVQQPEAKISAEANTTATPAEKPNSTKSNTSPTSVTLEMENARVAYTVPSSTGAGLIEGSPIEIYRVASGEQRSHSNFTEDLGNGVKLEMIAIPGGSFLMGSEDFENTKPVHKVTLSPFHIGKFQVTQQQWQAVRGENPSHFKGNNLPVESISWNDATRFCLKLSEKTGKEYRLPTEAEWEYACLAGSTGKYCFGDDEALLEKYAWYRKNSGKQTHPVGEKLPNDWGLHDMHGNVWEWCQDWYDANYYAELAKQGEAVNPQGSAYGELRVLRGGSWDVDLLIARAVYRNNDLPAFRFGNFGFRVVCSCPPSS